MTEGRLAPAISLLRSALASSLELDAPLAAAQIRCRLARILLGANEVLLARSEFTAAKAGLRKACAPLALKRCERLFRHAKRARDVARL